MKLFFDYLNGILKKEKTLQEYIEIFDEENWKEMNVYMIMKYLYYGGFIKEANYLNQNWHLDKKQVFILLYKLVERKNIFIEYIKKESKEENEMINYICQYYLVNKKDAEVYNRLLTQEEKIQLLKKYGLEDKKIKKLFSF